VGICIGFRNYKAFVLFVSYLALVCFHAGAASLYGLADFVLAMPNGFELAPVGWAATMCLGFLFGCVLVGFAVFHFYLWCVSAAGLRTD
jgi:hypothetical protein